MSMKDLVVSISIRQKDQRDTMSESQEKLARKVYKKRINSWQDYFVKWSSRDTNDDEIEYEVDQEGDWNVGDESSDDEIEAIEEVYAPESPVLEHKQEIIKGALQNAQNSIPIPEAIDDAVCSVCCKRTYLPLEYHQNLVDANFLKDVCCDDCLVNATGHAECEEISCRTCERVGDELTNREIIKKEFANGTLIIVDDDQFSE